MVAVFRTFDGGGALPEFIDDLADEGRAPRVGGGVLFIERLDFAVETRLFGDQRGALLGHHRINVERLIGLVEGGEDCLQAVIVLLLDRIELVGVAAGALGGRREEGAGGVRHHVIAVERARDFTVELSLGEFRVADKIPGASRDEALGDVAVRRLRVECVAGQLFFDEACVGLVVVKGADDVIAIGPGVGAELILIVAMRVAVVDDVEPVAAPAFAIARRG